MSVAQFWQQLRGQAQSMQSPLLAPFIERCILQHDSFAASLSCVISSDLGAEALSGAELCALFIEVCAAHPRIAAAAMADLRAHSRRDPACESELMAMLYFKGFQALQAHRLAHALWGDGRRDLALYLRSRACQEYAVDIHPAASMGGGVMIDHATGVVIGSGAVVEDDVSMLHGVTLGGADGGWPLVRRDVLLGAGAKVLGAVEIGAAAKVGAGSLVLESVPPRRTVAGVPARLVGRHSEAAPAQSMRHHLETEP